MADTKNRKISEIIAYQLRDKAIWLVFIVLFIGFSYANPRFMTIDNLLIMIRQVSMYGIAAIGMTFVILIAGIDLSIGTLISLVNIVCAYLMVNSGVPIIPAILIALLVSTLIGLLNGFLIATIGIPAIIATFASQVSFEGATFLISAGRPIPLTDDRFRVIGQGVIPGPGGVEIPVPILIMIACFLLGSFILNKTYFGRYFYAIGGNEEAARLSGIRVERIKYLVYSLSGFFAGLAGIVLLSRTNSAQPTAGQGWEFAVITCVVLGGVSISGGFGKLSNVLAGVLIIGALSNGMVLMNISSFTQMVIKGIVLVIAVGFDCLQKKGFFQWLFGKIKQLLGLKKAVAQ